MDALINAIKAAGDDLRDNHQWSLDNDPSTPVVDTLFGQVLLKHLSLAIDPESQKAAIKLKIAALLAELSSLESE